MRDLGTGYEPRAGTSGQVFIAGMGNRPALRLLLVLAVLPTAHSFSLPGVGQIFGRRVGAPRGSAGSKTGSMKMCSSSDHDLLVVGAGTLGSLLIQQHRAEFPAARIIAETRSGSLPIRNAGLCLGWFAGGSNAPCRFVCFGSRGPCVLGHLLC